jgi:hypothetical protein
MTAKILVVDDEPDLDENDRFWRSLRVPERRETAVVDRIEPVRQAVAERPLLAGKRSPVSADRWGFAPGPR